VVGRKRKHVSPDDLAPVDLAARIGMPAAPSAPPPAAHESVRRVDGPIEPERPTHGRPLLIGANEAPPARAVEARQPTPVMLAVRPMMIGLEEPSPATRAPVAVIAAVAEEPAAASVPLLTVREAPKLGEMDLVVTPLPTPDDWHHFELALRRLPGVGPLRIEYYRAGILKLRFPWSGADRLADAVANVPGYRIGILGEDRSTVQIRVARA
jgi:hypothetical protein